MKEVSIDELDFDNARTKRQNEMMLVDFGVKVKEEDVNKAIEVVKVLSNCQMVFIKHSTRHEQYKSLMIQYGQTPLD